MSQKNQSVKVNVTAKVETEINASKSAIVNQTLPQKNESKPVTVVPSVQDPNKFSKQNPFADFSGFEKTVDQMEPLAADVQSE